MYTDHNKWQYVCKLVKSGNIYEWYEYEIPCRYEKKKKNRRSEPDPFMEEVNREKNLYKCKKQIERIIYSNEHLNKFLTLTFADSQEYGNFNVCEQQDDISITNPLFRNFAKRMTRLNPGFEYFCIPEYQERGSVHYHLLTSLPYTPAREIEKIWSHGFIKIKRTDRVRNMAKYLTKYLTKDLFNENMRGKKKFFRSQNLNTPEIFMDDKALYMMDDPDLEFITKKQFNAPFIGNIVYMLYKKRDI